jgi:hypothetical protein
LYIDNQGLQMIAAGGGRGLGSRENLLRLRLEKHLIFSAACTWNSTHNDN